MNYKMKRLFQNISVSIFSLLLIFIILELAIRIVKGEYTFKNFTERKLSFPYQYDPYLGWIPKEGHWENQNIHGKTITILENGIRSNGDKTTKETAGLACILAVGDSFTFGDYVSDCETWPALLEKVSKGRVINGGVNGYGLDQIFLRADKLIKIYKPDILILSFIADDIFRCRLSKRCLAKPYFSVFNNELILKNVPVPMQEKNYKFLVRKIFGHSLLMHHIMKRAFPNYWLQEWGHTEVHSRGEGEQIAYLLFRHLRDMIQTDTLKHIFILVQYADQPKPGEIVIIDRAISGINDRSIKVIDLRYSFYQVIKQDNKRFNSFFKYHMTPEGNYFVACELQRFLNEIDLH